MSTFTVKLVICFTYLSPIFSVFHQKLNCFTLELMIQKQIIISKSITTG